MSDFGKTNEMCYVIMPAECMCASLGRRKPPQPTFNSGTSHVEINYYRVSLEISPLQNVFAFVPGQVLVRAPSCYERLFQVFTERS